MNPRQSQLMVNVAVNIRAMRKLRGWSVQDVADRIEALGGSLFRVAISKIENGNRGVDIDDLVELGVAFGVAPWELTKHDACMICQGAPPPGFTCNVCGVAT